MTTQTMLGCVEQTITMLRHKADQHIVLGPVVSNPHDEKPEWYFVVGTGSGNTAHFDQIGAEDRELADQFRAALQIGLIQGRPLVIHDTDDELYMIRLCETLWPCEKTAKIRAAIEAERSAINVQF